jgi:hypothetical protein
MPKKDSVVYLRVNEREKLTWALAAARRGITLSEYIRATLNNVNRVQPREQEPAQ